MERSIIVFHPDINIHKTNNEYTKKIYKIIEKKYEIKSFEWFLKNFFHKNIHALYLNWYENTVGPKIVLIQKMQYFIKLLILFIARRRKIKIVYVIHNKTPHSIDISSNIYLKTFKPFIEKTLSISDIIVELCEHTSDYLLKTYRVKDIENKIISVPHGKYTKYECSTEECRKHYGFKSNEFICCFVGKIDKYKNIDLLIKAFYRANINAKLLLVGKCESYYKEKIISLIKDSRVVYDFKSVSDYEMSEIMQTVNAIILPYNNNSLNSGILINAFSNGTTVIGTNIEMLKDFPCDLVYGYYHNDLNHEENLAIRIRDAYEDYKKGEFIYKGKELERIVNENYSWIKIEKSLYNAIE